MHSINSRPAGQIVLDTSAMSARDSFKCWWDMLNQTMTASAHQTGAMEKVVGIFRAKAWVHSIGEIGIFASDVSQDFNLSVFRSRSDIAHAQTEDFFLHLQLSNMGLQSEHCGRTAEYRSGDWSLGSTAEPHKATLGARRHRAMTVRLPSYMGTAVQLDTDHLGRLMSQDRPLNKLVSNYVLTLATGGQIPDAASSAAVARNLMELIALAANSEPEACRNGFASGMLLALTQYLDAHYARPELSPAHAAAHLGITTRHVHRLLERAGMTFSGQLFQLRLEHAHGLLSNANYRHLSITDIAYDCGFSDLAHFSRRYREMYGQSPSDTRGSRR